MSEVPREEHRPAGKKALMGGEEMCILDPTPEAQRPGALDRLGPKIQRENIEKKEPGSPCVALSESLPAKLRRTPF